MRAALGQIDLRHIVTGVVTAALLGGGGVIWSVIRPREDQAVEMALLKKDVSDLKDDVAGLKGQSQRMEESLSVLVERSGGVRPAAGKR